MLERMMRFHHYALLSPRAPIVTAPRFWLALLSLLALLAPAVARAQCVPDPDPPVPGGTVTCTGTDSNGFDALGVDDLTVIVETGATVDNGAASGVNALNLASENDVEVQAGAGITASGDDSHGIAAIDGNTITNAGSIVVTGARGHGISAVDANTITNSGSIGVSGTDVIGISVGSDNDVTNTGSITVSGAGGTAIAGGSNTDPTKVISNEGTIALSGGNNTGLLVGDGAAIYNLGTITAADANSVGLAAGSNDADAENVVNAEIVLQGSDSIGIQVGDDNFAAFNGGTITADTAGTTGIKGIQVGHRNTNVLNVGTITITGDDGIGMAGGDGNKVDNQGTLVVSGASGRGIEFGDDNTVIIGSENNSSASVTADGPDGIGVELGTAAGTTNWLRNWGTITGGSGTGAAVSFEPFTPLNPDLPEGESHNILRNRVGGVIDGSASGVAVRGSEGVDAVRNNGTIIGDVQLEGGDDSFGLWTGGDIFGTVDGGLGRDTVRLLGSGGDSLDLAFLSDVEVLRIVEGGAWLLTGSASFLEETTVSNGALVLTETVSLGGDYLQGAGTGLGVGLDPGGASGELLIDGNATIEAGAFLQLDALAPIVDEGTYTILTTTSGTLTGIFDNVTLLGDTGLLRYFQVATPNSLSIEFSLGYASAAATGNQRATAIHLDEIVAAGPTGDMDTVFQSLRGLPDPELQAALDMLHPEVYDAQASAILSFGRSAAELAAFRRPRCEEVVYERRPEIVAPPPCSRSWMPWGSAFGLFAERNGKSGHIDFDQTGGGLILGADHPLGEHFLVYGFLGAGYTAVEVDGLGDGSLVGATLGAGVRWSLGGTRIHGLVGYAHGWHEQERKIDFGDISRKAKADYGSNLLMAFVKAGHTFRLGSLDLEPLATVEYGYLMEDGFGESGAGDIDLDVEKRSNSVLSTTVGARLAYTLFKWEYVVDELEWADGLWTPELTARWRGNWIGRERDLDARMVGAPVGVNDFTVAGQDAKQGVQFGAGLVFQPLRVRMSIRADYDGFYGDGSTIHRIGASIRVPLGGSAS